MNEINELKRIILKILLDGNFEVIKYGVVVSEVSILDTVYNLYTRNYENWSIYKKDFRLDLSDVNREDKFNILKNLSNKTTKN